MSGNNSSGSSRIAMTPIRAIAMKVISVVTGLLSANRVWIMRPPQAPPCSAATRAAGEAAAVRKRFRSSRE